MYINPINSTSFQHKWNVKTAWKKGKLPSVKYGFYGDELTTRNCTVEHLLPVSKGGKTKDYNLVLASAANNQARSNFDINEFAAKETANQYLNQFKGIRLKDFNGDSYIQKIKITLRQLGFQL